MAFLFDTDALSEVLRRRPAPHYLAWLATVPRADQFTSAVVIGELYEGAFRSADPAYHVANIESRLLPAITVLPYDGAVARRFGEVAAALAAKGRALADADVQIAATALHHGLTLVTGDIRHFERIPDIRIDHVLAAGRRSPPPAHR